MKISPMFSLALTSCLVAGCASLPAQHQSGQGKAANSTMTSVPTPPPVVAQVNSSTRQTTPTRPAPLPAAARSLAGQAEQASQQGDQDAAAAYLERALRVAPNHPVLWQNLAVVRYRQQDYGKVEGLALKSNSLAANDPALRAENWRLIAEVRRQRGDSKGATAANAELRRLSVPARQR